MNTKPTNEEIVKFLRNEYEDMVTAECDTAYMVIAAADALEAKINPINKNLSETVTTQLSHISELESQQWEYECNASAIINTKDKRIAELETELETIRWTV